MNTNSYLRGYTPIYPNNFNQQNAYEQNIVDQIDGQINQLVGMRNQIKNNNQQQNQQHQPTAINQTFQLAPNGNGGIRYANSIEEVSKETVFFDTPYFSKDLSVLWIKNASGDIKAYELSEIIQKDEKDIQIDLLQEQIEELKGMIKNERNFANDNESKIAEDTTTDDESIGEPIEKNKSASIQRVPTSKKK